MDVLDPHRAVATPRRDALDDWARRESKSATCEDDLRRRFTPVNRIVGSPLAPTLIAKGLALLNHVWPTE